MSLLSILKKALADIAESVVWYEARQTGLGTKFVDAVEQSANDISRSPEGYQRRYKRTREKPVRIFPYILIYTIEQKAIYIHAVFAARKDPSKKYSL